MIIQTPTIQSFFDINNLTCSSFTAGDPVLQVVRVKTTYWSDNRGMYSKKAVTYLKRKSGDYNPLLEDCSAMGAMDTFPLILNLDQCEDGLYSVIGSWINTTSWDGDPDGYYEYELIPYVEEE